MRQSGVRRGDCPSGSPAEVRSCIASFLAAVCVSCRTALFSQAVSRPAAFSGRRATTISSRIVCLKRVGLAKESPDGLGRGGVYTVTSSGTICASLGSCRRRKVSKRYRLREISGGSSSYWGNS